MAKAFIEETEWQHNILEEMKRQLKTQFGNELEAAKFYGGVGCLEWENVPKRKFNWKPRENFCDCKPNFEVL